MEEHNNSSSSRLQRSLMIAKFVVSVSVASVDAAAPSSQARREMEEVTSFFMETIERRLSARLAAGVE
jgi:hypothetical protein